MTVCTGCILTINGAVPNPTGQWFSQTVLGQGVGAFSGVTNFPLGTLDHFFQTGANGRCTGVTGSLTATSPNQSGTGFFTWVGGTYTCTGHSACSTIGYVRFTPDPFLAQIAPGYAAHVQVFNTEGDYAIGRVRASGQFTSPSFDYTANCGFSDFIFTDIRFSLSPYSGWVGANVSTSIQCGPCITGA